MISQENILNVVHDSDYQPLSTEELAQSLSVPFELHDELESMLLRLQKSGEVFQMENGKWGAPSRHHLLVGRMDKNPRGFGFAVPVKKEFEDDIYIPEQRLAGAMNGDLVLVKYRNKKTGKSNDRGPSGKVVKILDRAHDQFVGTLTSTKSKKFGSVIPDDPAIDTVILVEKGKKNMAKNGDKVLVKITHWPEPHKGHDKALGEVLRVLGTENSPEIDELAIIHQFDLPQEFPAKVLKEAENIPYEPDESQMKDRRDLSDTVTVAIDPDDAKDRDDALSIYYDENKDQRVVLVHIADVSCHVKPGSELDKEAYERGLSVYLVRSFIPMIPKEATQQKLSLAKDRKKPAKTVELRFDDSGKLLSSKIYHSVVRLNAEMTYKQVQRILEGDASQPTDDKSSDPQSFDEEIKKAVVDLDHLAGRLRAKRVEVGSVDLDVPEYDVHVGADGKVKAVSQIERDRSHSLVEEFMLAANVAVATFMKDNNLPALYRVHEKPDKEDLEAFSDFVKNVMGKDIDPFDRKAIQKLLIDVRNTNYAESVNMELLRCMKRAIYTPECAPHFALHFPTYSHFTSPIRRYPDLVIHQILDQFLAGKLKESKSKKWWTMKLSPIAQHCSLAEENADKAEREMVNLKLLRYLQERGVGENEVFDGVITGVKEFGFFAQLQDFSIEGLVKVNKLKGDYYVFQPDQRALIGRKKGKQYRLGQSVKLKIDNIDINQRQMDFDLAE